MFHKLPTFHHLFLQNIINPRMITTYTENVYIYIVINPCHGLTPHHTVDHWENDCGDARSKYGGDCTAPPGMITKTVDQKTSNAGSKDDGKDRTPNVRAAHLQSAIGHKVEEPGVSLAQQRLSHVPPRTRAPDCSSTLRLP